MALFTSPPTPFNDLLPSLMVEVCLVLAPRVKFFFLIHVVFSFFFDLPADVQDVLFLPPRA